MPIFNISNFNSNNVFSGLSDVPTPSVYENIKLFGGSTVDDLHGETYIYTDAQIAELILTDTPEWLVNTFILAHFDNDLQAGNITSLPTPIEKWLVLRKSKSDSKFTKIDEIDAENYTYVDRLAKSNDEYTYQLIPKAGETLGEPLQTLPIETDFKKVVLIDPTTDLGFSFCYDLRMSEIGVEEDVSFTDTRGKFQTYQKGLKHVHVGTIGTLANSNSITENEIVQDIEFLKGVESFITNGNEKIIKFPKGLTYRVVTHNYSMTKKQSVNSSGDTMYVINFEYRECGELDD